MGSSKRNCQNKEVLKDVLKNYYELKSVLKMWTLFEKKNEYIAEFVAFEYNSA